MRNRSRLQGERSSMKYNPELVEDSVVLGVLEMGSNSSEKSWLWIDPAGVDRGEEGRARFIRETLSMVNALAVYRV